MYDNYIRESGSGTEEERSTAGRAYLADPAVGLYRRSPVTADACADCFENPDESAAISCATTVLTVNPISNHSRGNAFDLRATPGVLEVANEAVRRGLISGRVGDELWTKAPHVHMKIESVSQEGLALLSSGPSTTAIV
jgi:hypothetical protein